MRDFLSRLERHLSEPKPRFDCYACGDQNQTARLSAFLRHEANPPATADEIQRLRELVGSIDDDLVALYSAHDGLTLYRDTRSSEGGFRLFRIRDMPQETERMDEALEEIGDLYAMALPGVAIGEIPNSANYFVYPVSPNRAGQVFYLMHDPLHIPPLVFDSVAQLLDRVMSDPAQFLYDMGCYARYSDGQSATQWIPKAYVSGDIPALVPKIGSWERFKYRILRR
jgi:hypothetical protein